MTTRRGVAALPATVALIAVVIAIVAGALVAGALETAITQRRVTAAQALAAVDGCLAGLLATMPAGWDFIDLQRGPDGVLGTPDDGQMIVPAPCTVRATPLADRAVVDVTATAGGGRRTVQAIVAHAVAAGVPAPLWAADVDTLDGLQGVVRLSVAPGAAPVPAALAPAVPERLDAWMSAHAITLDAGVGPPEHGPAPPLATLVSRARTAGTPAAVALSAGTPVSQLAFAEGDLAIDQPLRGAGLLVIGGRLRIGASLVFHGVVAAAGGIEIDPAATLEVHGSLWCGLDPLAPAVARGTLLVDYDPAALADAHARLPLPRRVRLLSMRDHEG